MLACNRLRIDGGDSSPVVEYRIENGLVESRSFETDDTTRSVPAVEKRWQRLTPEQLTSRVLEDKVLAHWLSHRMGIHQLVRACSPDFCSPDTPVSDESSRAAA
jgi:hypothetical protein